MLAALVSGCGDDAATTLRALTSWAATSAMVGRAWADDETPRAYTERALDRVREALEQRRQQLGALPSSLRVSATPVVERVEQRTRQLTDAVRAGDRRHARILASALADEAGALRRLADGARRP